MTSMNETMANLQIQPKSGYSRDSMAGFLDFFASRAFRRRFTFPNNEGYCAAVAFLGELKLLYLPNNRTNYKVYMSCQTLIHKMDFPAFRRPTAAGCVSRRLRAGGPVDYCRGLCAVKLIRFDAKLLGWNRIFVLLSSDLQYLCCILIACNKFCYWN